MFRAGRLKLRLWTNKNVCTSRGKMLVASVGVAVGVSREYRCPLPSRYIGMSKICCTGLLFLADIGTKGGSLRCPTLLHERSAGCIVTTPGKDGRGRGGKGDRMFEGRVFCFLIYFARSRPHSALGCTPPDAGDVAASCSFAAFRVKLLRGFLFRSRLQIARRSPRSR